MLLHAVGLSQELKHRYKTPNVHTTIVHPTWVRTPLLGKDEATIRKSLGGIIEPELVADAIVAQILSCRGAQLVLPSSLNAIACLRAFPNWMQELFRDIPGAVKW